MKYFISFTLLFCALFLSVEIVQAQASLKWNKYDFVPGEKIILEDTQEGEVNGEFPSRWDLAGGGSVENAAFGDFNVIYFKEAESCIVPFFKEPEKDNLPDLFTIKPESMGVINSIYGLLKDHPELNLSVEGHTDSDGDEAMNQALSDPRAQAVVDQLVKMGTDASRLTSRGWGESKPAGSEETSEGKAANRRVEFINI